MGVAVVEFRTRSAPRDTVALEMSKHRGAVDVEASGKLENRAAFRMSGNQPFDVSVSEADLGLAIDGFELPDALDLEVSSASMIANSLVKDLNEVLAGICKPSHKVHPNSPALRGESGSGCRKMARPRSRVGPVPGQGWV